MVPKVGVTAACVAFATSERSYRHRRRRDGGPVPLPRATPTPRAAPSVSLTDDGKDTGAGRWLAG